MKKNMTPTQVVWAARCLHSWYLECHGNPALKVEVDARSKLLWAREIEHERRMVATLPGCEEPRWDGKDWEAGFQATQRLMRAGVEWICQGVLVRDDMHGRPDLLQRIEKPSCLGSHSYCPVDVWSHKNLVVKAKEGHLQLASYAFMLEPTLGYRPDEGAILLNDGILEPVNLCGPNAELEILRQKMLALRDGHAESIGFRSWQCDRCPWAKHCTEEWMNRKCVCLVPGVHVERARLLNKLGIRSFEQLVNIGEKELAEELGCIEYIARSIHLHAKARVLGKPIAKHAFSFPEGRPILFYSIGTTDDEVVYLHGLIRLDGREEKTFLARSPQEEKEAWHAFLDYLAGIEGALVYTWGNYERGYFEGLCAKHGGNQTGWQVLNSGVVDLCNLVQDNFALPVVSYGIEDVATLFGFHWQAEDVSWLNSGEWYGKWPETGDQKILEKIVRYNLDNVAAMAFIYEKLKTVTTPVNT